MGQHFLKIPASLRWVGYCRLLADIAKPHEPLATHPTPLSGIGPNGGKALSSHHISMLDFVHSVYLTIHLSICMSILLSVHPVALWMDDSTDGWMDT
jgi:hypothetical protein